MKHRLNWFVIGLLGASLLALSGCGGETGTKTSTVTGTVLGTNFQPMRDAVVSASGQQTRTSTTGAFFFEDLPDGDVEFRAEGYVNNTRYIGRTTIFNIPDAQQNNVNVIVAPASEVGIIRGVVRDREGFLLQNASVFALYIDPDNDAVGSSIRAVTDSNGRYVMRDVPPGTIEVSAAGRGYRSDFASITLGNWQDRTIDFTLTDPGLPNLNPPNITSAVTWVSHPDATRGPESGALAWAKNHFGDKSGQPTATSRSLRTDMIVEADFVWDYMQFPDLLGFNVYRGFGTNGSVSAIDLSFDPLANYYVDIGIQPDSTYSYAFSTVATLYPDYNNSESQLSNRIVVDTLNLLRINPVTSGPRFSWQGGSGAAQYQVYIFDGFPSRGANFIFESNTTSALSYTYNGPNLQSGRTYYYIVLGTAFGGDSRTISQVGTFVP